MFNDKWSRTGTKCISKEVPLKSDSQPVSNDSEIQFIECRPKCLHWQPDDEKSGGAGKEIQT